MARLAMRKEKFSGLDGRTYVRWTQIHDEPRPFMITASPSGVSFKGAMIGEIEDMGELQDFAKLVSDAVVEFTKLRDCVRESIVGPK